ncbi:hypothetical protein [Pseudoalteromonas sp. A757]|uniref:hypothetical protein n=1 Tax=Pseudoalteromonas sp. A757 TaxID=2250709 RepID=UPI000FFE8B8D|nr:hypothetical protein [Pseudoalteromonas sp. A757]RXE86805.1 hypothetical protein DRB05_09410 [Pseudoalteromonas sp. A757]
MSEIAEPLRSILRDYCHVEAYDPDILRVDIGRGESYPYDGDLVKSQLREAIDLNLISLTEYEELTDEDFDSVEDLHKWLEEIYLELL